MRRIQIAAFSLLLASCANLNISRNEAVPSDGQKTEFQMQSFIWGFVPGRKIPPASTLCSNGKFEAAQLGMNGNDVLLTALTFGIYVPHRVTVVCSK